MPVSKIAIIGLGPRGLGLLERLYAHLLFDHDVYNIELHLIDPDGSGTGVHSISQGSFLLTNTVAGQITMFSDQSVTGAGPILRGPSLAQWANINENVYVSRSDLGRYLRFCHRYFTDFLSEILQIHEHKSRAVGIEKRGATSFEIYLDNGINITADYVFICVGHSENSPTQEQISFDEQARRHCDQNPNLLYVPGFDPNALDAITPEARVGIRGTGLTANDIVAVLTEGRGGKFLRDDVGKLHYEPSGREPSMILFSRQSLPFSARAQNEKGIGGQHKAKFFTREAIDVIRRSKGSGKLNFRTDLLPLLKQEMLLARQQAEGKYIHTTIFNRISKEDDAFLERIFFPLKDRTFSDIKEFRAFIIEMMKNDLAHANLGNLSSPVKAATDIIRDVRDNIRYAVEFGGLDAESHHEFIHHYVPLMNRIAVGPPKQRVEQWLALFDAGILDIGAGPGALLRFDERNAAFALETAFEHGNTLTHFDALIEAHIAPVMIRRDQSPLIRGILRNGIIRPFVNDTFELGGIDVTANGHPRDANGITQDRIWILGTPTEGANFYTYILPRPLVNSRFIQDSGKAISEVLGSIRSAWLKRAPVAARLQTPIQMVPKECRL